jgi:hypothetical protein
MALLQSVFIKNYALKFIVTLPPFIKIFFPMISENDDHLVNKIIL